MHEFEEHDDERNFEKLTQSVASFTKVLPLASVHKMNINKQIPQVIYGNFEVPFDPLRKGNFH